MRRPNARLPKSCETDLDRNMDSLSLQLKHIPNFKSVTFSKSPKTHSKFNLFIVSSISIAFSFVFCVLFVLFSAPEDGRKFGIIIDGGSTGTRIHVFEYQIQGGVPRFDFGPNGHSSMKINPGLSSFEREPRKAGESLVELLEYGKSRVPKEFWRETEVRLMATAGLRLLEVEIQELILESCRGVFRSSGFKFHDDWASVITGSDEGLYAWVVANYALGTLGGDPHHTTGIIELGGASVQVTFVSHESIPPEFSRTLKYGNSTYHLYSNSLLHFGQNAAFDSLKELLVSSKVKLATGTPKKEATLDPCTPKGYAENVSLHDLSHESLAQKYSSTFHATGNFSECRAAALKLLQNDKEGCPYHQCILGSTFIPKLHGRFLATENFFYTSQLLGLDQKAVLSDLMAAGERFCEENWSNIRRKHSSSHQEEDLLHYCFSSAYIVALLHDSLGFTLDNTRIEYTNQVENTSLDWALGAFILQSTGVIDGENHGLIASTLNDSFLNVFLLIGAALSLALVAWYAVQWNEPYLKTIYDLEKGRYIVTQISRS